MARFRHGDAPTAPLLRLAKTGSGSDMQNGNSKVRVILVGQPDAVGVAGEPEVHHQASQAQPPIPTGVPYASVGLLSQTDILAI